jgi:hypothetical protein
MADGVKRYFDGVNGYLKAVSSMFVWNADHESRASKKAASFRRYHICQGWFGTDHSP